MSKSSDTRQAVRPGTEERASPKVRQSTGILNSRTITTGAVLRRLVVPLAILALWIGLTEGGVIRPLFLPGPVDIWDAFRRLQPLLVESTVASVSMTLIGFLIGTVAGVTTGLTMAYSKTVREVFGGVFNFLKPVPIFALIPLFVLWFGIGKEPQIVIIALAGFIILGVTTYEAVRNVDAVHVKAALTLGAGRGLTYRKVIVPAIVPHLLGAIRVAAAASWGLDVAAEFLGAQVGLGHLMIVRQQYLDTASLILLAVIYSILALILDQIIIRGERPLTRWTERSSRRGIVASIVGQT